MLEDMDIGMHDLACVQYIITSRNDSSTTTSVSVSGSRWSTFAAVLSLRLCVILETDVFSIKAIKLFLLARL